MEKKVIERNLYLRRLIERRENGLVKVVTGIRRCGKSFLLFNLYCPWLRENGVKDEQIISISLEDDTNADLRDPKALSAFIREKVHPGKQYYVMIDEAQYAISKKEAKRGEIRLYDVLNGLLRLGNVDVYITGSNSKFLSSDVLTEFGGRGDEVRLYPLSFAELMSVYPGDRYQGWGDYFTYGGLPPVLFREGDESKSTYLENLNRELYLKDIARRYGLHGDSVMPTLLEVLASATGSLTNPNKLTNTFKSRGTSVDPKTLSLYLEYLQEAFIINRAERYDIKGKHYIGSPYKYYFTDVGLRNAELNFREQEENHIMENILYNELLVRGYNVDVGVIEAIEKNANGNYVRKGLEVDFVCNRGSNRCYIQSAFEINSTEKLSQEQNSLRRIGDSFKKIIVQKDTPKPWRTSDGVLVLSIFDFLLNPDSLDL